MKLKTLKINIPINLNFILIKNFNKLNIILYDKKFKINILVKTKNIKMNKNLNNFEIQNNFLSKLKLNLLNELNRFLEKLNKYYFLKIKFKGKGYKIGFYKKKKIINFFFGRSHKSIIIYNNIKINRLNKYKFIIYKNNLDILKKISKKMIIVKKLNEYTNRGLRLSRQIIIKRKGKKGSFV